MHPLDNQCHYQLEHIKIIVLDQLQKGEHYLRKEINLDEDWTPMSQSTHNPNKLIIKSIRLNRKPLMQVFESRMHTPVK